MRRHDHSDREERPGRDARAGSRRPRISRRKLAFCGTFVLLVSLLSAASPRGNAQAKVPVVSTITDGIGGVVGGIGGDVAVNGFKSILSALFGGLQAHVTQALTGWLTTIPNFTGGNVAQLRGTTTAIAFGLIGVVMTFAFIRYYISGLSMSGSGGMEAVEGIVRSVGAVLLLIAWPFFMVKLVDVANAASQSLLHSPSVTHNLVTLFRTATIGQFVVGGPVGWAITILIAIVGIFLLLALLMMKIVLSAATVFLFVGMPVAIVLWPISELSWITRYAMRGLVVCLIVPFVWVLVFATFAAVGVDALTFQGGGGFFDKTIIKPLVGVAMLYLSVVLPKSLMKAAMLGSQGAGGGFMSRMGSFMAARTAGNAVAQHIPAQWGGTKGDPAGTMHVTRGMNGAIQSAEVRQSMPASSQQAAGVMGAVGAVAGGAASGGVGAAAAVVGSQQGAGAGVAGAASRGGDTLQMGRVAGGGADGASPAVARPPAWDEGRKPAFDAEMQQAQQTAISAPPSTDDVAAAVGQLSPAQQSYVGEQTGEQGGQAQRRMALMATDESLSPEQRDAFRTLAAADHATRVAGFDIASGGSSSEQPTEPMRAVEQPAPTVEVAAVPAGAPTEQAAAAPPVSPAAPGEQSGGAFGVTPAGPAQTPSSPPASQPAPAAPAAASTPVTGAEVAFGAPTRAPGGSAPASPPSRGGERPHFKK